MTILVIAEHDNASLKPETNKLVHAASQIGGDIDILVVGSDVQSIAEAAAKLSGVGNVFVANSTDYLHQLAENIAPLVAGIAGNYTHVLAAATTTGKNILPRVAAMLDVSQLSDVIEVVSPDIFKRPIYAGNAIATVQSEEAVKVMTVRVSAFDAVASDGSATISAIETGASENKSKFVKEMLTESERPELTAASTIISGGRGMQNGENFAMLEKVADKLGAAVGASRAAVDAGFVPNDMQVGQTGKIVAPDLYIAVGISGAIQHLAGMKDSKIIVAINKDEEAPIFQVSDYGLVGDLFDLVPELESKL